MRDKSGKLEQTAHPTHPERSMTPQDTYGFGPPKWESGHLPHGGLMTHINVNPTDDPKTVTMTRGVGKKIY